LLTGIYALTQAAFAASLGSLDEYQIVILQRHVTWWLAVFFESFENEEKCNTKIRDSKKVRCS